MIGTEQDMAKRVCPLLAMATGKQTRCQGSACALWRWHAAPGVTAENYSITTTEPVGGCGLLSEPSSQHWFIAAGRRPGANSILSGRGAEPFDARQFNRSTPAPAEPADHF